MKPIYKLLSFIVLFLLLNQTNVFAQGCVAIRSTGGICTMEENPDSVAKQGGWLFNSNSRYYRSFRHFIGKQEQYQRIAMHNNVINNVETEDATFTRLFNDRWALAVDVPFVINSRSQLASGTTTRFATHSSGVGDVRVTGYYWLLNPAKSHKFNVQMGLGIKFATGNSDYQDYFLTGTGTHVLAPVDQSIQPGDGGTGISLEMNTFYSVSKAFSFYGNFFYLANPRDVNGTPTATTSPTTPLKIAETTDVESVPDQYLIRAGGNFMVKNWDFSLGMRDDCLPVRDLIGNSDGFRRPGYILSLEPGATWSHKNIAIYGYLPIAIMRDRTQSVPDERGTYLTNSYVHGDAAFADYVINIGVTVKF
jgi:hypothetical protein